MKGQLQDLTLDPECRAFLKDLEALNDTADNLSKRLDHEYVAIGAAWGITEHLRKALERARAEFSREEE